MTIQIGAAVNQILAQRPVPVILIDTCSFVDLFRRDEKRYQPRVPVEEIQAAADLLALIKKTPDAVHLFVPELIPREYSDHADREEKTFSGWTAFHDENQTWLMDASLYIAVPIPTPYLVHLLDVAGSLRSLADDLLAKAKVLDRDPGCLDRAVLRLINKTRPSHKKEMKDSMNLEQCLELSRQLSNAGFRKSRVWVSSNTNDFAQGPTDSRLHLDLQGDFASVGLKYFPSLRAAVNQLRTANEIP